MANCRSCKAPIIWALTEKGKRIPLDAEPAANGNIEIVSYEPAFDDDGQQIPRVRHLLKGEAESPTLFGPPPRYVSHFFTCPDGDKWRKRSA